MWRHGNISVSCLWSNPFIQNTALIPTPKGVVVMDVVVFPPTVQILHVINSTGTSSLQKGGWLVFTGMIAAARAQEITPSSIQLTDFDIRAVLVPYGVMWSCGLWMYTWSIRGKEASNGLLHSSVTTVKCRFVCDVCDGIGTIDLLICQFPAFCYYTVDLKARY